MKATIIWENYFPLSTKLCFAITWFSRKTALHILIGQSSIVFQFVQHCNIIVLAAITGEVGNKQEKYSGEVRNIVSGTKPSATTKLTARRRRRRRRKKSCVRTGQSEVVQEVLVDLKMVQIYFSSVQKCLKWFYRFQRLEIKLPLLLNQDWDPNPLWQ